MKKFGILGLVILAVIALIAVPGAQAQIGAPATPVNSSLNVSNGWGVSSAATISLEGSSQIAVQLVASNNAANASNTVATIDRSVDGINWVTGYSTITLANGGTLTTTCISNYTVGADGFWRLSVTNQAVQSSATLSNTCVIRVNKKSGL